MKLNEENVNFTHTTKIEEKNFFLTKNGAPFPWGKYFPHVPPNSQRM